MVTEFQKGWVEEAVGHVGDDVWAMMTAKQQVGIVHSLLADAHSALPLIKTMQKIYECVKGLKDLNMTEAQFFSSTASKLAFRLSTMM